jgi:hypothetical protein
MESNIKNYFKDNIFTIIVLAGMIFLYVAIPSQIVENLMAKAAISPRFFPTFSIVCILISCVLLLITDAFERLRRYKMGVVTEKRSPDPNISYLRVILMAALLIIWYLVFTHIGFIISTIILIFLTCYILGGRHKPTLVLFPIIFTLTLYFSFVNVLHVNLPEILF